ncbi:MAG: MFS transporter, partial [Candidatus Limnocylindrales bacterium]
EAELGPANSAWSTLDNLAFVIGPAIAGLLIAASGLTLAFLLHAISFGLVAIVLWRLPPEKRGQGDAPGPPSSDPARATGGPTPTVSLGRSALPLAGLAVVDTVAGFVFGGLGVLTVVLAVEQLGADEASTGFLNAAVGVGGLLGALASGAFVVRPGLRGPLVLGSLGLAAGVAGLGLTSSLGPALVAIAIASAGSLLTEVVSTTIFQRIIPDAIRGRALGTIATVSTLAYAAGSLVLPVAAGAIGIPPVLIASGILVVLGAVLAAVLIGAGGEGGPSAMATEAAVRVARLAVFAGVPETRLATAFSRAEEIAIPAGTTVIRQGDPADQFYVILDGSFAVDRAEAPDAPAARLRTMGPDEVFGEIGLLTGAPRSATVTALSDARLLALGASDFLELVASAADVGPRLLALHRGGAVAG